MILNSIEVDVQAEKSALPVGNGMSKVAIGATAKDSLCLALPAIGSQKLLAP